MTQFVVRHVAPEMAALGLLELVLTFALAYILFSQGTGSIDPAAIEHACLFAATISFIAFVVGLYRPQMFTKARSLVLNTVVSALLSFPAVWIVSKVSGLSAYWPVGYDTLRPVKIVTLWCGAVIAIRFLFLCATRCNLFVHRVAILGDRGTPSVEAVVEASRYGFLEISAVTPERASAARLSLSGVRTFVVPDTSVLSAADRAGLDYERRGIAVETERDFWEKQLKRIDISNIDRSWLDRLDLRKPPSFDLIVGRALDIGASLGLLLLTFPLMIAVAVIIKFSSPGPVLYRQERVGHQGSLFTVLKFRSMSVNAEASGPAWAQRNDPRVTRIGSFMRKTRIDELPQLINILQGEMSFIGPRPERPHFVEQLAASIPFYEERLRVKPGLTGWAQVNYPYGASIEDARAKLSYDLFYVKNKSLVLDILIILSTVRVILFQEGAR